MDSKIYFNVSIERNGRPRNEAPQHLAPLIAEVKKSNVEVNNTIKTLYMLLCSLEKDEFEKLFQTKIGFVTTSVPKDNKQITISNWTATTPIIIPDSWKKLGVTQIFIDVDGLMI